MGQAEAGFFLFILLATAIIVISIVIRLIAGSFNHERIKKYIENKGGTVTEIQWSPFGPGWFGSQNEAIYKINYRDRDGNAHLAFCKTSMLAGVYLTEDNVIEPKKP